MNSNEKFWQGDFGDQYSKRNVGKVEANIALFGRILAMTDGIESALELGCGTGQNLQAIHTLMPSVALDGVELNEEAAKRCKAGTIHNRSIRDFCKELADVPGPTWSMVFTKGVLIHQHPDDLPAIYRWMYHLSRRYLLVAEYYNPSPVEVSYRGRQGVLWKRDFAGEMLDQFSDLRLVDVGFAYHRSPFPQDDITYFLMEKR